MRKVTILPFFVGIPALALLLGGLPSGVASGSGQNEFLELTDYQLAAVSGTTCCSGVTKKKDCHHTPQDGCQKCQTNNSTSQPDPCGGTSNGVLWLNQDYEQYTPASSGKFASNTGSVTCNSTFSCTNGAEQRGKLCKSGKKTCTPGSSPNRCSECRRTGTGANPVIKYTSSCSGSGCGGT